MAVEPLKPSEVVAKKKILLPDDVIEVWNNILAQECNSKYTTIYQDDVVKALVAKGYSRQEIHKKKYLDIEDIYREAGWKVEYDKPGYNESGPATFKFIKP